MYVRPKILSGAVQFLDKQLEEAYYSGYFMDVWDNNTPDVFSGNRHKKIFSHVAREWKRPFIYVHKNFHFRTNDIHSVYMELPKRKYLDVVLAPIHLVSTKSDMWRRSETKDVVDISNTETWAYRFGNVELWEAIVKDWAKSPECRKAMRLPTL